jgi:hypothetical protein
MIVSTKIIIPNHNLKHFFAGLSLQNLAAPVLILGLVGGLIITGIIF